MNSMIYNPLEEYERNFKHLHMDNTIKYFQELTVKSGIDVEANRKTVKDYHSLKENLSQIKKKLKRLKFLRVVMFITLILIPFAILKITPQIKALKNEIDQANKKLGELLALAKRQVASLNALFSDRDALKIIESTIPMISFADCFSVEQEANMVINYDFNVDNHPEQSTIDVLAGQYNENQFLIEKKLFHRMGMETYHGHKTIEWEETYYDSDGEEHTRTKTEILHATVTKPKPFYSTQTVLNYCAQGAPKLSFTRNATHFEDKSDKAIDRYLKRKEKKLKKKTDKAIKHNESFVSMSNTEFEVLFGALDRTDEVEFRTMFTPLAQTNIVDLIRSQSGYGDDFDFIKQKRTNKIISEHSQQREINLTASSYFSYSFDVIKESFINKNVDYFKATYFDFAPIWAIPMYQERSAYSLQPIPEFSQKYSHKECEALLNQVDSSHTVHPQTQTNAILKSYFVRSQNNVDKIRVEAHSYDIIHCMDFVSVHGGDGHWHDVPVPWDDYIPLERTNVFFVGTLDDAHNRDILAVRNNLCIFN